MKITKITNRNTMFTQPVAGWDGLSLNMGLILGMHRNYLIDTNLGKNSVIPVIDYIGETNKPLIIINTHAHWDHVWGNHVFANNMIISHKNCRDELAKTWDEDFQKNAHFADGEVHKCLPNVTFDSNLHFADDGIYLFHTPGHTTSCISIYDEAEKILYVGDAIGDEGENDIDIIPYIYTTPDTMQATIETWKKFDFDLCVIGHNKPHKKDVLCTMESVLAKAWDTQIKKS